MLQKYADADANQHEASYTFSPLSKVMACPAAHTCPHVSDNQCHQAVKKFGEGDLQELMSAGDTWVVK